MPEMSAMQGICYTSMPFGDTKEKKNHYANIFECIIRPAAEEAGFTRSQIIRDDRGGGQIMMNVMDHISTAQVAIVDLSESRPNVYYEMGVIHAFNKYSTVLIKDTKTTLAFDISGHRVIDYDGDLGERQKNIAEIRDEILDRINNSDIGKSDNVVHDSNSGLPPHLPGYLKKIRNEQQVVAENSELREENQKLRKYLKEHGVADIELELNRKDRTISDLLISAKRRYRYAGADAIREMERMLEKDDLDAFLDYLNTFLDEGAPSRDDITGLMEISQKANNTIVNKAVLEACNQLYPKDPDILLRLANMYARMPQTKGRQKAIETGYEAMGIERGGDGKLRVKDKSAIITYNLNRLLDVYIYMKEYHGMLELIDALENYVAAGDRKTLIRNRFVALTNLNEFAEAEKMIPEIREWDWDIVKMDLAIYYARQNKPVDAYFYYEEAFRANRANMRYPIALAGHIMDYNLMRSLDIITGGYQILPVDRETAGKAAAAFILYAYEHDEKCHDECRRFLKRNGLQRYLDNLPKSAADCVSYYTPAAVNRTPLDYCLKDEPAGWM